MILHIANDFPGSTVYKNLILELDNIGLKQIIYTPVKSNKYIGRNEVPLKINGSTIIYSNIIKKFFHKVFYKFKVNKIRKDLESKVQIEKIKCIHAHTWFSDGGVAFELHKKYNIPYIIAIRNTDLNLFWRLPYLKSYGLKILRNASKVILISETYKNRLLADETISRYIKDKFEVLPNGVDQFWLENSIEVRSVNNIESINILYVGNFNSGKNVENLIKAVISLNAKFDNIKLSLVGGGGDSHNKIIKLISKNSSIIKYYGKLHDKDKLLAIYREHQIFAMPSIHETFGLVYIEALLQGIPILYTKNEGVDGMYDDNIGESVDNSSTEEIVYKLSLLINNLDNYNYDIAKIKLNHNWNMIAKKYINIYNLITK